MATKLERGSTPNGTLVEQSKLICVNPMANNNKFIIVGLYDSGDVFREWGRVRTDGDGSLQTYSTASGTMYGAGRSEYDKYLRSKTRESLAAGKRYSRVDALDAPQGSSSSSVAVTQNSLKDVAANQIVHTSKVTQELIKYLAQVNVHQILQGTTLNYNDATGLFSTPFGILTQSTIADARISLGSVADCIAKDDYDSNGFNESLEQYLRLVPHDLGMRFTAKGFLPNLTAVRRENDILDSLDASYVSVTTQKPSKKKKDNRPKVFNVQLEKVEDDRIIKNARKLYRDTKNSMHSASKLHFHAVFAVDIEAMSTAYNGYKKLGNIMRLWHGTKASNLLSILKVGLIIPPSQSHHCTGRLFGDGLYFSDQSTKSLNYAMGAAPGQSRANFNRYFMFLADVAMGKAYSPTRSSTYDCPRGYDSVFAKAGSSMGYGSLRNNEMIVYKTAQANLVYLVEFRS